MAELTVAAGMSKATLAQRLRKHQFTVEDAVELPLRSKPTVRLKVVPDYLYEQH